MSNVYLFKNTSKGGIQNGKKVWKNPHLEGGGGTKFVKCVLDGRPEMQRKFFPKFVTPPFSGHTL